MKKFLYSGKRVNEKYDILQQAKHYIDKYGYDLIDSFIMTKSDHLKCLWLSDEDIYNKNITIIDSWKDLLNCRLNLNFEEEILFTMFELEGDDNPRDFFGIDFKYNDMSKVNTPEDVHDLYKEKYFIEYFEKEYYTNNNCDVLSFYLKTMGVLIGISGMKKILNNCIKKLNKRTGRNILYSNFNDILFYKYVLTNEFESVILDLLIKDTIIYLNEERPDKIHGYINRINKIIKYIGDKNEMRIL